ncbi:hypothetical protein C8A05DRAFT_43055 [Staphylotrichum tortipilum]|uniref:DUF1772-domain-containing protein n=1 Tax=Staphylotrichum tortipilum TaxID=2831512 RepID=A0AAN6MN93_9PEZI|nr:hypothetical protein C8A05DRAFT_43055 [Staphylotrichum longicolle]
MSDSPSPTTLRLLQSTALLLSSLSAGTVLTISTFVVPRLLESPTPIMLTQWTRTYARGAATVPAAAATSAAAYLWLGLCGSGGKGGRLYLAASALTVGIVPYTVGIMLGTNGKLKALEERVGVKAVREKGEVALEEEQGAKRLVDWWGVLNLGRAGLLIAGTVCGLVATL